MTKKFAINFDEMIKKIKDQEKGFKKEDDGTVFVPTYKDDGTHVSIIRFLPSPDTDVPFVKKLSHGFEGPGGWFIEECPSTLGKKCPCCEYNKTLWSELKEEEARRTGKRLNYWANILIVKDPQKPENDGKVFKYRFGKKIYDKIMEKISPTDGITDPVMVFDWYEGANFKLSIKQIKVKGKKPQANYDASVFAEKTPVGTDAKIESVVSLLHPLNPIVDPSNFKEYDDLADKLNRVLSGKKTFSPRPKTESAPDGESGHEVESTSGESFPSPDGEDSSGFFASLRGQNK